MKKITEEEFEAFKIRTEGQLNYLESKIEILSKFQEFFKDKLAIKII